MTKSIHGSRQNLNDEKSRNFDEKYNVVEDQGSTVPDGGYGWVVCFVGFVVQFIIFGVHNSFGILFTYLMKDLKSEPSDTAWIGSMAFGMNFLFGPLISGLALRYSCRLVGAVGGVISALGLLLTSFSSSVYVIYVTYSFIWGLGSSMNFGPTMMILGQYFQRHLSIANGLVTSGGGMGSLAFGPLYQLILEKYGWRILTRILSGTTVVLFISSFLYRPAKLPHKEIPKDDNKPMKFIDLTVWKDKAFVFWAVSMSFFFLGYFVPFIYLPNHAVKLNIKQNLTSLLIGYLSIASTVSRVISGIFLNHPRINRFYVLQVCFLMMAVTTTLCPLAKTYEGLILYVVVFGFFDGCFVMLIAVTTADIVGPTKVVQALGNLYGIIAIPVIFGPPLAGSIFEISGSYENAFFVAGGVMAIGTCTLSFIPMCMKPPEPVEIQLSGRCQLSTPSAPTDFESEKPTSNACADVIPKPSKSERSNLEYETQRFSQNGSTWTLSDYAIGRSGDVFGLKAVIESMDRESCV